MSAFSQGRYSSKSCALERADVLEARVTNVVADSPWCDAEHEPLCPSSVGFNSEEMRHAGNELADFLGVFLGGLANAHGYKRLTFELTGLGGLPLVLRLSEGLGPNGKRGSRVPREAKCWNHASVGCVPYALCGVASAQPKVETLGAAICLVHCEVQASSGNLAFAPLRDPGE